MTQKELLYLEDAIGHEQNLSKICEESLNLINDDQLKSFIENELNKHNSLKEELINLLKEKANGQ